MGRLGVWHTEAHPVFEAILHSPHLELDGIYTHFSSADTNPAFTAAQRELFQNTINTLPGWDPSKHLVHADNSAGLESFKPGSHFNAVRVGLLQFGVASYRGSLLEKVKPEPVLSFHTRVGLVKTVPRGTGISYGRTCVVENPTQLAILTAGYGDGIPTSVSNTGKVLIRGRRCPILGRVTMDQTVVDVSGRDDIAVGDRVTLIGRQGRAAVSLSEFSNWSQEIPWETLCSITKRVPRAYRTDSVS
jgi:alanine racemase